MSQPETEQGVYQIQLPGKTPQRLKLGTGWTGFGLRGQIADQLLDKGTDPNTLQISIGDRDISNVSYEVIRQITDRDIIMVTVVQ